MNTLIFKFQYKNMSAKMPRDKAINLFDFRIDVVACLRPQLVSPAQFLNGSQLAKMKRRYLTCPCHKSL